MAVVTSSVPEHCRTALDKLDLAREILAAAKAKGVKFLLPADVRVAMKFEDGAETFCTAPFAEGGKVPEGGMAIDIGAKVITVCSITGRTARLISRFRGPTDIIGLTTNERAYRKLALSWGITPVMSEVYESTDVLFYHALKVSRAVMQLEKGDKVITSQYAGTKVTLEDVEYLVVRQSDILAIVE